MFLLQTTGLFVLTALAEIVGCFLPYFWLRKGGSIWLLVRPHSAWRSFPGSSPSILPRVDESMRPMAGSMWRRPLYG